MYTASLAMMYKAANLALVVDAIMCLMICVMLRMAPLLGRMLALVERKKWPPARLQVLGYH